MSTVVKIDTRFSNARGVAGMHRAIPTRFRGLMTARDGAFEMWICGGC
jgi:hypothetical protein